MLTTQNSITMAEKEIKPKDMTTVYGTGKSKHMPAGVPFEVHTNLAEQLIASAKATAESDKGGKKTKDV